MNKKIFAAIMMPILTASMWSCNQYVTGTIYFELNGGSFPESFGVTYLTGKAGEKIEVDIPDPTYDGYYFVGWYEKNSDGEYRAIHTYLDDDGKEYYPYPYGTDTWYAYFEPLSTISFDLTEGAERNGQLIAPSLSASDFDGTYLNGYVTKSIPSESYLPTATADYLYFDYWYTEYPLVAQDDENGITHYTYDTTQEKGEYEFATQFGTAGMSFPDIDGLTLYAAWTEYPTVRVHTGLDAIPDFSFQLGIGESVGDYLIDLFEENTGLDLNAEGYKYYPSDTQENRFAGFYLDSGYTQSFGLETEIYTEDIDLYVKWDQLIDVYLDYNGGTLDGETYHEFAGTYYTGDKLGYELYNNYKPEKEYATFQYYAVDYGTENQSAFNFENDELYAPAEGKTLYLTAVYEDYPTTTVTLVWPTGYSEDKQAAFHTQYQDQYASVIRQAGGTDISEFFATMDADIQEFDSTICVSNYLVTYDGGTTWTNHVQKTMPDEDCEVQVIISYKMQVHVTTSICEYVPVTETDAEGNTSTSYKLQETAGEVEEIIYLGSQMTEEETTVYEYDDEGNITEKTETILSWNKDILYPDDERLTGTDEQITGTDGNTYLRDDVYAYRSVETINEVNYYTYSHPYLSVAADLSQEAPVVNDAYRVYLKGITLSFVDETGASLGSLICKPHAAIDDDFKASVLAALESSGITSYTNLQVDGYNLITYGPYVDSTVVVVQ